MSDKQDINIIRAEHGISNAYFIMSRKTAQDESLSLEAIGTLAYLLSKPDGWICRNKDLEKFGGKRKITRILKELVDAGYLTQPERIRDPKTNRFTGWTPRKVFERPQETPVNENPEGAKRELRKAVSTTNVPLDNTDKDNTDKDKKPLSPKVDSPQKPKESKASKQDKPIDLIQDPTPTDEIDLKQNMVDVTAVLESEFYMSVNARKLAYALSGLKCKGGIESIRKHYCDGQHATADEIKRLKAYYQYTYPDLSLPSAPQTIHKYLQEYREFKLGRAQENQAPDSPVFKQGVME